jgi:NitT/TauT family transport system ATP-binding protein
MSIDAPFITMEQVSYTYGDAPPVVRDVDWIIPTGEFHSLVGRSGCGKTTLLKLAAGLLSPTSGTVHIGGTPVNAPSRHVGFVFQTPSLLEWLTVLENVLLPISLARVVTRTDRELAMELLERVGIDQHAVRYPQQLSGGQQSRAALARALVTSPPALLMDEPFAALDAITREELQDDLLRLTKLRNSTVLFVTHDIAEAVYLSDHVTVMENGAMSFTSPIKLTRHRDADTRYDPGFNATCREIRAAMATPTSEAA